MADTTFTPAHAVFQLMEQPFERIAETLTDDGTAAMSGVRRRFEQIAPTLAYLDNPSHPMAMAVFGCACSLALYLELRERGVDRHVLGRALHEEYAKFQIPPESINDEFAAIAQRSRSESKPGEFVFDVRHTAGDDAWEMDITSCGICALFSKHDAMDFVPYMCALDDLFSDMHGQGLRRTGTIALGASHCDFKYDPSGESLRLADQYPVQIQLRSAAG